MNHPHKQMREMLSMSSLMDNSPEEELATAEESNTLSVTRRLSGEEEETAEMTATRLLELSEDQEFQKKAAVW